MGTRGYPGYERVFGVREDIRGTRGYSGYERISGVREGIRGTRGYSGYEGGKKRVYVNTYVNTLKQLKHIHKMITMSSLIPKI